MTRHPSGLHAGLSRMTHPHSHTSKCTCPSAVAAAPIVWAVLVSDCSLNENAVPDSAGQEGSLLMQLFWGGQIEFNVPAVFPTEPESMLELPPQLAPALFAIAGVGSAHPPEKQLCISGVHVTYGDETEVSFVHLHGRWMGM